MGCVLILTICSVKTVISLNGNMFSVSLKLVEFGVNDLGDSVLLANRC